MEQLEINDQGDTLVQPKGTNPEPYINVPLRSMGQLIETRVAAALEPYNEKFEKLEDLAQRIDKIYTIINHSAWRYFKYLLALGGITGYTIIIKVVFT